MVCIRQLALIADNPGKLADCYGSVVGMTVTRERAAEIEVALGLVYLAGDGFAAGDIATGIATHRGLLLDIERPHLPHVEAWNHRLRQRPAF